MKQYIFTKTPRDFQNSGREAPDILCFALTPKACIQNSIAVASASTPSQKPLTLQETLHWLKLVKQKSTWSTQIHIGKAAKQLHRDIDYQRHLLLLKTLFRFEQRLNTSHCIQPTAMSPLPVGCKLSCSSMPQHVAEESNHAFIPFIILIMPWKLLH